MNLLLAMDDSKYTQAALEFVINQYLPQTTKVRVIHVNEPIVYLSTPIMGAEYSLPPDTTDLREENLKTAQKIVNDAAGKLSAAGFKTDTAIQEGDPRSEILDLASAWPADLIVIGSHGRKGFERFLLGSVSSYVATHAKCSVQIVRIPPETTYGG